MNNDFDFENKRDDVGTIKDDFKDDLSKADLRSYKDPEGMSVAKLDLGLWYVENKESVVIFLYFLVFLFGLISWIFFFYQFGSYAINGIAIQNTYAQEIAYRPLPTHAYYKSRATADLQLYPVQILTGTANKKDLISQVSNPSKDHWARFKYHFLNSSDEIGNEEGFVLPGETKQIVLLGQNITESIGGAKLVIEDIQWGRINRHDFGDWEKFKNSHLNFQFSKQTFSSGDSSALTEKIPMNLLSFNVKNSTSYNYWNVPLMITLYNYNDIVSVITYELNDFESASSREISLTIPGSLKKVTDIKIVPDLDITRFDLYKDLKASPGTFR